MESFFRLKMPLWLQRLLTRGLAIMHVIVVTALYGNKGVGELLMLSQVILSMQLPFAVIPLILFVSDRQKMGELVISRKTTILAWVVAAIILVLNFKLWYDTVL